MSSQKERIRQQAEERHRQWFEEEQRKLAVNDSPRKIQELIRVPARVTTREQLNQLLQQLEELQTKFTFYGQIEILIEIQDEVQD
jgi:hypothetical protein